MRTLVIVLIIILLIFIILGIILGIYFTRSKDEIKLYKLYTIINDKKTYLGFDFVTNRSKIFGSFKGIENKNEASDFILKNNELMIQLPKRPDGNEYPSLYLNIKQVPFNNEIQYNISADLEKTNALNISNDKLITSNNLCVNNSFSFCLSTDTTCNCLIFTKE